MSGWKKDLRYTQVSCIFRERCAKDYMPVPPRLEPECYSGQDWWIVFQVVPLLNLVVAVRSCQNFWRECTVLFVLHRSGAEMVGEWVAKGFAVHSGQILLRERCTKASSVSKQGFSAFRFNKTV